MKNIFKNTIRDFKKNKIITISLTFLLFLTLFLFSIFDSVRVNINNTYNAITTQANLHDFTVNENYFISSNDKYSYYYGDSTTTPGILPISSIHPDFTQNGCDASSISQFYNSSSGVPGYEMADATGGYKHFYLLLPSVIDTNTTSEVYTFLKSNYQNNTDFWSYTYGSDDQIGDLIFPIVEIDSATSLGTYTDVTWKNTDDYTYVVQQCNAYITKLDQYITNNFSPLQNYLSSEFEGSVYYKQFRSLDITMSNDNIYYKIVQSNPEDSIDKMYLLNYNNKLTGRNNFSQNDYDPYGCFSTIINGQSGSLSDINKYLTAKSTDSDSGNFIRKCKLLASAKFSDSPLLLSNDEKVSLTDATTLSNIPTSVKNKVDDYDGASITGKNYKYTLTRTGMVPSTAMIENWTAFFTVAAPEYMQKHSLSPVDLTKSFSYSDDSGVTISNVITSENLNKMSIQEVTSLVNNLLVTNPNNTANIDGGVPFVIIGSGITPDFIYPMVGFNNVNPNTNKEFIIFPNSSGYERILDGYASSPVENYIVCKILGNIDLDHVLNDINTWSYSNMNYAGMKVAYKYNDTANKLNSSGLRISFIPTMVDKISYISYTLTLSVVCLGVFVAIIIITRYISHNRKTLGILIANGVSKRKTFVGLLPFALIPTFVGAFCGYLLALFTQLPVLSLFTNYWMIPTNILGFSWIGLLFALLIPGVVIISTVAAAVYFKLRTKPTILMKTGSEYKINLLSRVLKKPFKRNNIITRFKLSLAANSLGKLTILTFLTSITMTSLIFAIDNNGKISTSVNKTLNQRNYEFAIDLSTPTDQGGQYVPINGSNWGVGGIVSSVDGVDGRNFIPGMSADRVYEGTNISGAGTTDNWNNAISNYKYDQLGYGDVFNMQDATSLPSSGTSSVLLTSNYNISQAPIYQMGRQIDDLYGENYGLDTSSWNNMVDSVKDVNGYYNTNVVIPTISDNFAQLTSLQYLKNKLLDKLSTNFFMGMFGIGANPWNIATSLSPDNEINKMNDSYDKMLYYGGWKAYPEYVRFLIGIDENDSVYRPPIAEIRQTNLTSPYGQDITDGNDWVDNGVPKFRTDLDQPYLVPYYVYDGIPMYGYYTSTSNWNPANIGTDNNGKILNISDYTSNFTNYDPTKLSDVKFVLNDKTASNGTKVDEGMISLMTAIHTDLMYPTNFNEKIYNLQHSDLTNPVWDNQYNIRYNVVPFGTGDESYTYIDCHGGNRKLASGTHIMGIKPSTNFVKLVDKSGKDISNLLNFQPTIDELLHDPKYPLIINSYAAKQYGLHVGSNVTVDVNNTSDRYSKIIDQDSTPTSVTFTVLGINNTTIGSEFYTSQDAANWILGLKSHYEDNFDTEYYKEPNSYYIDSQKYTNFADETSGEVLTFLDSGDNTWGGNNNDPTQYLWDISKNTTHTYGTNVERKNSSDANAATSYGFNGVFTASKTGSNLIANTMPLYSPTGLYAADQFFDSDATKNVLKYGSNLMIAAQITGLWQKSTGTVQNPNDNNYAPNPNSTDIGNQIYKAWYDSSEDDYTGWTSDELIDNFVTKLISIYGKSQYINLINNASDKDAESLIFNNLSDSIQKIETGVLIVLSLAIVLIVLMLTLMIVDDTKRINAIMNAIGYRDNFNIRNTLSVYAPTFILSILLSIPFAFVATLVFNSIIFSGIGILIPSTITWWTFPTSFLATSIIYLIAGIMGYRSLKRENIVNRIKEI